MVASMHRIGESDILSLDPKMQVATRCGKLGAEKGFDSVLQMIRYKLKEEGFISA
jgi:hypothetical protein